MLPLKTTPILFKVLRMMSGYLRNAVPDNVVAVAEGLECAVHARRDAAQCHAAPSLPPRPQIARRYFTRSNAPICKLG